MSWHNGSRVLAIGIDAAEPQFVRELIERDELPALKSLLAEGRWLRVKSPAHIGSGSVWPTFITGEEPAKHGICGEWSWQPETMDLTRYSGRKLQPFWKALRAEGMRVGVLDVPFAPFTGFSDGFELCEWGPHDLLEGRLQFAPQAMANLINEDFEPHPLLSDRLDTAGPHDYDGLKTLASQCLDGVKLRGTLAQHLLTQTDPHLSVIVFTEIHHTGHYLWHTVDPDHTLYNRSGFKTAPQVKPTVKDIYREVDQQIGKLVAAIDQKATVMVFSLHGMRATYGVPAFLESLLCEQGYARLAGWSTQSWTERAIAMLAALKRHTPDTLKRLYYKSVPTSTTLLLARPTMMPAYDWQQTRAFALPADQHGWVHVNLIGRESQGSVRPEDYEQIRGELERMLLELQSTDGSPVVRDVIRTAQNVQEALVQQLPDLVVHWENAAFSNPLRIKGSKLLFEPVGKKFTGRHQRDGFCIFRGREDLIDGETLRATQMHDVITKSLRGE